MMTTAIELDGLKIFSDTENGFPDFLRCFEEVWEAFDQGLQEIIRNNLQAVHYSKDQSFVDQRRLAAGICYRREGGQSEIRFYSQALLESDRYRRYVIAHELRHSWQFATSFRESPGLELKLRLLIWESDAEVFATSLFGPKPNTKQLQAAGLPTDDDFDRLVNHWRILSQAERLDVLQLAAGIVGDRKD